MLNQNCLLLYEEKENYSKPGININNINDFLKYNSDQDFYFDNGLEYIDPKLFYCLIRTNHIYLNYKEEYYFSELSLKDAFKRKLKIIIDYLLRPIYESVTKINKDNISNDNNFY